MEDRCFDFIYENDNSTLITYVIKRLGFPELDKECTLFVCVPNYLTMLSKLISRLLNVKKYNNHSHYISRRLLNC